MRLYTVQAQPVLAALARDGVCHSRRAYVERKYGESAPVFLTAYDWFVAQFAALVPPPEGAEYPYWAFASPQSTDRSGGGTMLTLDVPDGEAVYFDLYDWNAILRLQLLGGEEEARAFRRELAACGLSESGVMLSRFYPQQRQQILDSWPRLFRHHAAIAEGRTPPGIAVQAGLWRIKRAWVTSPAPELIF